MATRLDKMVLDALEDIAVTTKKPIDEVLQAAQKIIENNLVKTESDNADEISAQAKPAAAAPISNSRNAGTSSANNPIVSSFKPATAETAATKTKRAAPKSKGSAAKQTTPKVKASASASGTASDASADERDIKQFTCEFPGCSRAFLHKSSRSRHYKLNHKASFTKKDENEVDVK
ncbi:uncharacterized protein ColSpa_09703 [Colletotrichum spaethianum]|uniref:C2H2-type domain-containing protein n=1 Tax=Colletotrichum spaethianum TaxID=700344 RepID=A0AA37PC72_9PEZI|nr:uncharacterized protein ColSpa_09703 [Colletotrichum spaethianum]GKT49522.1 hypothetical protein ColSpa_09703 [Colletotrichum spaethianum]